MNNDSSSIIDPFGLKLPGPQNVQPSSDQIASIQEAYPVVSDVYKYYATYQNYLAKETIESYLDNHLQTALAGYGVQIIKPPFADLAPEILKHERFIKDLENPATLKKFGHLPHFQLALANIDTIKQARQKMEERQLKIEEAKKIYDTIVKRCQEAKLTQ